MKGLLESIKKFFCDHPQTKWEYGYGFTPYGVGGYQTEQCTACLKYTGEMKNFQRETWREKMGENIYARRAIPPPNEEWIGDCEIKSILKDKYGITEHDDPVILNENDLEYIRGLKDAKVEDAEKLFNLLLKHGSIEIWTGQ